MNEIALRLSRSSQRLRRKFRHSKWLHRLNLMHVKRLIFDHKCRLLTKTTTRQRRRRVTLMQHRALHRNYSVHEHIFQCSRDEPKKCVNKCDMIPIVRPARGGRVRVKKIEDNDLASSVCTKNRAEQSGAEEAIRWNDLCSTHCVYCIREKNMCMKSILNIQLKESREHSGVCDECSSNEYLIKLILIASEIHSAFFSQVHEF